MSNVEKYAGELLDFTKEIADFGKKIQSMELKFKVSEVIISYVSMFDRFCPFKEGDKVELVKNIPMDKESGWYSNRHFMIWGAKATVLERGYHDGMFTFGVMFDNETRIDLNGNEQPVEHKHIFHISESYFRKSS